MMLYTITVYPVDDAIIGFSNTSRCRRDHARKKQSRDGIYFAIPNKRLEILTTFIRSKYYGDAVRSISLVCSR